MLKQVKKWKEFFRDPTFWWDNRLIKNQNGFPDFKHVSTGEGLWLDNYNTPSWVASELQSLADPVANRATTARYKSPDPPNPAGDHPVSFGRLMDNLRISAQMRDLVLGKQTHEALVTSDEHRSNIRLLTGLIDMYCKCGELEEACKIFDAMEARDSVSYNAIILGCSSNGEAERALEYYSAMKCDHRVQPNDRTYVSVINACSKLTQESNKKREAALRTGVEIHEKLSKEKKKLDRFVATGLVDMYARYGDMQSSSKVFQEISSKDTVSWNALIHGYVLNKEWENAISQFQAMRRVDLQQMPGRGTCAANARTYNEVLVACGSLMEINLGKEIHELAKQRRMLKTDLVLATSLVNFYAKCGDVSAAQEAFDECVVRNDTGLWNSLIEAYTLQGRAIEALKLFHLMQDQGCKVDYTTFVSVLNACSHAGLVDEGRELLEQMPKKYRVEPGLEHYGCLIDMLGRANQLSEALKVLRTMPFEGDAVAWTSLLGACRKWNNFTVGKVAFERLVEIDAGNGAIYVLMANIFGSVGMFSERDEVLGRMRAGGSSRKSESSWWTDSSGKVHFFSVGDRSHSQSDEIQAKLRSVMLKMNNEGYVTNEIDLLKIRHDEREEDQLCGHTEKLAVACALVNSSKNETIRILKNIRVCEDCHAATAEWRSGESSAEIQASSMCSRMGAAHVMMFGNLEKTICSASQTDLKL